MGFEKRGGKLESNPFDLTLQRYNKMLYAKSISPKKKPKIDKHRNFLIKNEKKNNEIKILFQERTLLKKSNYCDNNTIASKLISNRIHSMNKKITNALKKQVIHDPEFENPFDEILKRKSIKNFSGLEGIDDENEDSVEKEKPIEHEQKINPHAKEVSNVMAKSLGIDKLITSSTKNIFSIVKAKQAERERELFMTTSKVQAEVKPEESFLKEERKILENNEEEVSKKDSKNEVIFPYESTDSLFKMGKIEDTDFKRTLEVFRLTKETDLHQREISVRNRFNQYKPNHLKYKDYFRDNPNPDSNTYDPAYRIKPSVIEGKSYKLTGFRSNSSIIGNNGSELEINHLVASKISDIASTQRHRFKDNNYFNSQIRPGSSITYRSHYESNPALKKNASSTSIILKNNNDTTKLAGNSKISNAKTNVRPLSKSLKRNNSELDVIQNRVNRVFLDVVSESKKIDSLSIIKPPPKRIFIDEKTLKEKRNREIVPIIPENIAYRNTEEECEDRIEKLRDNHAKKVLKYVFNSLWQHDRFFITKINSMEAKKMEEYEEKKRDEDKYKEIANEMRIIDNIRKEDNPDNYLKDEIEDAEDLAEDVMFCKVNNISDIENCRWLKEKVHIIRKLNLFKRPIKHNRRAPLKEKKQGLENK